MKALLTDAVVYQGDDGTVMLKALDEVEGEVNVNQRKGRKFLVYDFESIKISYEVRCGETTAKGKITATNVDSVSGPEDFDMTTKFDSDKTSLKVLNALGKAHGPPAFKELFGSVIREMEEQMLGDAAGRTASKEGGTPAAVRSREQEESQRAADLATQQAAAASKGSHFTTSLELTEEFNARPADIFACFTDIQRVCAFTGTRALMSTEVGSKFSMFDDNITGEVLEVVTNEKLVLKWRLKAWMDDQFSRVEMTFAEKGDGVTLLTLKQVFALSYHVHTTQSGVPDHDRHGNDGQVKTTEDGWKRNIFHRIKAVFGFGSMRID